MELILKYKKKCDCLNTSLEMAFKLHSKQINVSKYLDEEKSWMYVMIINYIGIYLSPTISSIKWCWILEIMSQRNLLIQILGFSLFKEIEPWNTT